MDPFDADCDRLLDSVEAALPSDTGADSDAEIGIMLEHVAQAQDRFGRYQQRGRLLLCMARKCKALKAKRQPVPAHVLQRIRVHNEDMAKTREDLIDLSEKKPAKYRGTGAYKHWVPAAIQRVCWGLRPRKRICKKKRPQKRIRGKRAVTHVAAPAVMSARACAQPSPWLSDQLDLCVLAFVLR